MSVLITLTNVIEGYGLKPTVFYRTLKRLFILMGMLGMFGASVNAIATSADGIFKSNNLVLDAVTFDTGPRLDGEASGYGGVHANVPLANIIELPDRETKHAEVIQSEDNGLSASTSSNQSNAERVPQTLEIERNGFLGQPILGGGAYQPSESLMGGNQMLQILAALFAVLMLIASVSWMIRRMNGGGAPANSLINVLASYTLGPKQRVVLVEVNRTCLLLGVGTDQVRCLHEFKKGDIEPDQIAANQFSHKLQEILAKGIFK